jgi:hypothetical protein
MTGLRYRLKTVGAQPCRMVLPIDFDFNIEVDRRIYCRHYDLCLDYAVEESWVSWSCKHCAVKESITVEEMRAQAFEILKTIQSEK